MNKNAMQHNARIEKEIVDVSAYAARIPDGRLIDETEQTDGKTVPFTQREARMLESAYKGSRLALKTCIVWIIISALVGVISLIIAVYAHH